ncbi:aminotransferase class V-fold PLP-dependent enzyme [Legionella dresdenensis]|uniref:Probable cysteine desulfurase n=1 Tax=Legionella dresdenensis TaxID=450200 RepID=A0ABV8CDH1_9GAMM
MNNYYKYFPLLSKTVDGMPITYLDSASTTPKPRSVIDAVNHYYTNLGANVHRGVHPLSEGTTEAFEHARYAVAAMIGASPSEIIFTRNATESFNLIAHCIGLEKNDEIVLAASEHHSNMLPWQHKARLKIIDLDDDGVAKWEQAKELLNPQTRLLTIGHISNVTGVIAPVPELVALAHSHGVPVMIDAAQSISHLAVNVKKIGCDFMGFSSHKMFGPSGVGVLYVNKDKYNKLSLFNIGGGMIKEATTSHFIALEPPFAYESGTPNIEGVIGYGAAVNFITQIGFDKITNHNRVWGEYCVKAISSLPGVRVMGGKTPSIQRTSICSFAFDDCLLSPTQLGHLLANTHGMYISAGTHCTHVLHKQTQFPATMRISGHIFNDTSDIDRLVSALREYLENPSKYQHQQ